MQSKECEFEKGSRIAIISDIHGNSTALEAVLADIHQKKCDNIIVLGDVLEGFDPKGCIKLLRKEKSVVGIRGNTENYFFTSDLEKFPLRNLELFDYQIKLINWTRKQLDFEDILFLSNFKSSLRYHDKYFIHDTPLHANLLKDHAKLNELSKKYQEFIFHSKGIRKDERDIENKNVIDYMEKYGIKHLYIGHTHEAFIKRYDDKYIINPGSIGMSLDGNYKPSWMFIKNGEKHSIRRVDYDVERAIDLMRISSCPLNTIQENYSWMLQNGMHYRYR